MTSSTAGVTAAVWNPYRYNLFSGMKQPPVTMIAYKALHNKCQTFPFNVLEKPLASIHVTDTIEYRQFSPQLFTFGSQ